MVLRIFLQGDIMASMLKCILFFALASVFLSFQNCSGDFKVEPNGSVVSPSSVAVPDAGVTPPTFFSESFVTAYTGRGSNCGITDNRIS